MSDNVNHPAHYKSASGLEAIDVIDAFCADLKGTEAVCTANALKYILRWKHKNGVEDLKKAKWYLDHLIKKLKGDDSNLADPKLREELCDICENKFVGCECCPYDEDPNSVCARYSFDELPKELEEEARYTLEQMKEVMNNVSR